MIQTKARSLIVLKEKKDVSKKYAENNKSWKRLH